MKYFVIYRIQANIDFVFSQIMSDDFDEYVPATVKSYHFNAFLSWVYIDILLAG